MARYGDFDNDKLGSISNPPGARSPQVTHMVEELLKSLEEQGIVLEQVETRLIPVLNPNATAVGRPLKGDPQSTPLAPLAVALDDIVGRVRAATSRLVDLLDGLEV
jgi:hypothetical protein